MTVSFIHLHLHSEYSIEDSLIRIPSLISSVTELGMPAVAITDVMNLFGVVKFYKAAVASGIKPIIGSDVYVENFKEMRSPFRLVLLCQNDTGYKNLIQLISRAYTENQVSDKPIIRRSWFKAYSEGLIALSGGTVGDIGQALLNGKTALACEYLDEWLMLFPDRFYIELQRTGRSGEESYVNLALDLAVSRSVPVVATNGVCFINREDYDAHEVRVCIHEGVLLDDPRREKRYSFEQYLRSPDEMISLFADVPEAIQNTVEIAKRCNVMLSLGKVFLPHFPVTTGVRVEEHLEQVVREALKAELIVLFDPKSTDFEERCNLYYDRLALELDVIHRMGFSGYFLIVADFVRWAKENGVPVGPGRGSGAGSLVAYLLKITGLDPIAHHLLFERFLNPERVSMPDFDIDFCMEGRDRVIDYVAEKYGRSSVSQIITFGTMAAKAVVRDVGRVLGYGYGFVDKIAKLIPFELGITLTKALKQEELLKKRYEEEEEVRALIDLAKKLEGLTRNAGKHAGGVVIAPSRLVDFTPLYCEEGGENLVSQLDKDDVETIGLVKFDFLGLRTLTIINWALQMINRRREHEGEPLLDISEIPTDDPAVFDLLKSCRVMAVFQLDKSRGMKDLIKRLQPDSFEEIVALIALFRPGPLQSGMVDDFINRKHGRSKVEYPHPKLMPILKSTYGVILYQEQVMQIAQVLAGYSLGGADLLRRAMGKKKPKEMEKQRKIFVKGALENGVNESVSNYIFDLMEKFAGYGFNRSHSAAYALISYQTAWLKAHYPKEFMAAVLSSDMDNTDKLFNLIEECRSMQLMVTPPDVNESDYRFMVSPSDAKIIYGLGAIKGVGATAVKNIVENRREKGAFKDLYDFCSRIDLRKVNKKVLEALIKSGAFEVFGRHRAALLESLGSVVSAVEQFSSRRSCGQRDLFEALIGPPSQVITYSDVRPWTEKERLQGEKETLGYYLSGHPISQYSEELKFIVNADISALFSRCNQTVRIAGLVVGLRVANTRRNDRMAFLTLADLSGQAEAAAFSDVYHSNRELLQKDRVLVVEGEVNADEYTGGVRVSAKKILSMTQAREVYAKYISIVIDGSKMMARFTDMLSGILEPHKGGGCLVCVAYQREGVKAVLPLGDSWRIFPTDELIEKLKEMFGETQIEICY